MYLTLRLYFPQTLFLCYCLGRQALLTVQNGLGSLTVEQGGEGNLG